MRGNLISLPNPGSSITPPREFRKTQVILVLEFCKTTSYPYNKPALFCLDQPQVVFTSLLITHRMEADLSVLEKWLINRLNPSITPWLHPASPTSRLCRFISNLCLPRLAVQTPHPRTKVIDLRPEALSKDLHSSSSWNIESIQASAAKTPKLSSNILVHHLFLLHKGHGKSNNHGIETILSWFLQISAV